MKSKLIVALAVLFLASSLFSQSKSDEAPISTKVTERQGTPILVLGDGSWQIVRGDSSGNLYVTEAVYELAGSDTETVGSSWDKLTLDKQYEKFIIFCDDNDLFFWVAFDNTNYCTRVKAGSTYIYSTLAEKVYRKVEGTGRITVNYYNRKRR